MASKKDPCLKRSIEPFAFRVPSGKITTEIPCRIRLAARSRLSRARTGLERSTEMCPQKNRWPPHEGHPVESLFVQDTKRERKPGKENRYVVNALVIRGENVVPIPLQILETTERYLHPTGRQDEPGPESSQPMGRIAAAEEHPEHDRHRPTHNGVETHQGNRDQDGSKRGQHGREGLVCLSAVGPHRRLASSTQSNHLVWRPRCLYCPRRARPCSVFHQCREAPPPSDALQHKQPRHLTANGERGPA